MLPLFKTGDYMKMKNMLRKVAVFVSMGVIVYASYEITKSYLEYSSGNSTYKSIDDMFVVSADEEETETESGAQVPSNNEDVNEDENDSLTYEGKTSKWVWDYNKLLKVNSDALGYIRQESSRIQYPILQADDNKYYLTHAADKSENPNGAIFADCDCTDGLQAWNCVIFGHNMWTDSMFGSLLSYEKKKYYKKNPTFDIYIGDDHYIYYVFAAYQESAKADSDAYRTAFKSEAEFEEWEKNCLKESLYKTNIETLNAEDRIITLSTCTKNDSSKRFVVQLVRGEQVID